MAMIIAINYRKFPYIRNTSAKTNSHTIQQSIVLSVTAQNMYTVFISFCVYLRYFPISCVSNEIKEMFICA